MLNVAAKKSRLQHLTAGRDVTTECRLTDSVVISLLCYFAIFIHVPVLNELSELFLLPNTDATAPAKTSVINVIGLHPTQTHLEGGNHYADKFYFLIVCIPP